MTGQTSNGPTTDWQLDALLAAGMLACAAPALGAPGERTGCPPDASPPAWVHDTAEQARELAAQARTELAELWGATRTTLWGTPAEAAAPRLLIARASVERADIAEAGADGWADFAASAVVPERVVVLVHGIDESGFVWDDLAPAMLAAGLTPVRFDYANDQPIARTADQLADSLRVLKQAGVDSVAVVGHSSGGLAARDVVTRSGGPDEPDEPAGKGLPRISHLILLATPNRGSVLAPLQPLSEAREHLAQRIDGTPSEGEGWVNSTRDGRGEAAADLAEGSAFLAELNARELPRSVRITNIVARMVSSGDRQRLRAALSRGLGDVLDPDAARAVTGLVDDALDGLGDGVVSADSMALEGVEDTVEVRGNHRSMIRRMRLGSGDSPFGPVPPAVPVIVNRLSADHAAD